MNDNERILTSDKNGGRIPVWMIFLLVVLVIFMGAQSWYISYLSGELRESRVETKSPEVLSDGTVSQSKSSVSPVEPIEKDGKNSLSQVDSLQQGSSWDPLAEMQRMREEMDQLFGNAFNNFDKSDEFGKMSDFQPPVNPRIDLHETENAYKIIVDLPGAEESSIKITLEDQTVCIRAQSDQQMAVSSDDGSIIKRERRVSNFERFIQLPSSVNESALRSEYKNGILTIFLPKR